MTTDWKTGFNEALRDYIVAEGYPVGENPSFYSYIDSDPLQFSRHLTACGMASWKVEESTWAQFVGTFYEGDTTKYGADLIFSCNCGQMKDRSIRLSQTVGEAMKGLLAG